MKVSTDGSLEIRVGAGSQQHLAHTIVIQRLVFHRLQNDIISHLGQAGRHRANPDCRRSLDPESAVAGIRAGIAFAEDGELAVFASDFTRDSHTSFSTSSFIKI